MVGLICDGDKNHQVHHLTITSITNPNYGNEGDSEERLGPESQKPIDQLYQKETKDKYSISKWMKMIDISPNVVMSLPMLVHESDPLFAILYSTRDLPQILFPSKESQSDRVLWLVLFMV